MVMDWLLAGDPGIRWQVMRDLLDRPDPEWRAERARVESDGWGARLLAAQDPDGQWAGGSFFPGDFTREDWEREGQPWTATFPVLSELRELGLDPGSAAAERIVRLVGENSRWDEGDQPYWEGETEECINGRTVADGAYFGADVSGIVQRLLAEQQADGGWNCERPKGSLRSSFDTTINVLEGLLEYERATGGGPEVSRARAAGEEYLLVRGLYRRLSTGQPADPGYLDLAYPRRWHYDVLRGLDHFQAAGVNGGTSPDPRLADAVAHLRSKRRSDGRWLSDVRHGGRAWFEMDDGVGQPSRWITLHAFRVLRWWDEAN